MKKGGCIISGKGSGCMACDARGKNGISSADGDENGMPGATRIVMGVSPGALGATMACTSNQR